MSHLCEVPGLTRCLILMALKELLHFFPEFSPCPWLHQPFKGFLARGLIPLILGFDQGNLVFGLP